MTAELSTDRIPETCRIRSVLSPTVNAQQSTDIFLRIRPFLPKRVLHVRDEILHILDADRYPDKPVRDAELAAMSGRNRGVRHGGGVRDQRLDAAKTFAEGAESHAREKTLRP